MTLCFEDVEDVLVPEHHFKSVILKKKAKDQQVKLPTSLEKAEKCTKS